MEEVKPFTQNELELVDEIRKTYEETSTCGEKRRIVCMDQITRKNEGVLRKTKQGETRTP